MVARRSTAGFSMLESTIALAVVGLVAGTFLWGGPSRIGATAAQFRASAAHRMATGVLERAALHPGALVPGTEEVALPAHSPFRAARLTRLVTERAPGLLQVDATVLWTEPTENGPRTTTLTTLVARETEQ